MLSLKDLVLLREFILVKVKKIKQNAVDVKREKLEDIKKLFANQGDHRFIINKKKAGVSKAGGGEQVFFLGFFYGGYGVSPCILWGTGFPRVLVKSL